MAASGKLTATSADNLFDSMVTWLTGTPGTVGRNWTIIKDWRSDPTPENKIVLKGGGLPGGFDVFIGFHDVSVDGNKHVLFVKTYKYWDAGYDFYDLNFGNANGYGDTVCCVPHWNSTMNYWLYSNNKRVILVLKTQNRYGMCYLGSALAYLPSNEYIQPLLCVADGYTHPTNFGFLDDYDAMFFTGNYQEWGQDYRQAFPWRDPAHSGEYSNVEYAHHRCNSILNQGGTWTPYFHTAPLRTYQRETDDIYTSGNQDSDTVRSHMGEKDIFYNVGEPTALLPLYITTLSAPFENYRCLVGEWDGVYWCPSSELTPESTIDGVYTVFPNVDRTTSLEWMAIKEE
jgi:hypothetical protein